MPDGNMSLKSNEHGVGMGIYIYTLFLSLSSSFYSKKLDKMIS